jgi:hypothetical protein
MEEQPMAKRIFAAAAILTVILLMAHVQTASADGCELLKNLVRTSVHASAVEVPAHRSSGAVGSISSGRQTCAETAKATTVAFTEALSALNMPVMWSSTLMDRGDYCLSHDLRQCYPSQYPLQPSLPPNYVAFVYDAWSGVRKAVASQMPFGTAAGLSEFTSGSLDAALSSSLRTTLDGPLYSGYRGFDNVPALR